VRLSGIDALSSFPRIVAARPSGLLLVLSGHSRASQVLLDGHSSDLRRASRDGGEGRVVDARARLSGGKVMQSADDAHERFAHARLLLGFRV